MGKRRTLALPVLDPQGALFEPLIGPVANLVEVQTELQRTRTSHRRHSGPFAGSASSLNRGLNQLSALPWSPRLLHLLSSRWPRRVSA